MIILLLLLFNTYYAIVSAPIEGILSTVIRHPNVPDTLLPTVCPPSCDELFHAVDGSSSGISGLNTTFQDSCSCICPVDLPIYLNTAGYCVNKLDECRHNIAFESSHATEKFIPVVTLPAHNGVVLPRTKILWQESGIEVSPTGSVNCTITEIFFENIEHRWRVTNKKKLFSLLTAGGQTVIMFRGNDHDSNHLTGAVVQMKISCAHFLPDEHCLSFRVAGITGNNPYKNNEENRTPEFGVALLIVGLLILTLLGTFFIWQMCWRRKKQQLISDIQMQFLYHFKQQQEAHKAAVVAAQMARGCPPSPSEFSAGPMSPTLHQPQHQQNDYQLPMSPSELVNPRKRLYFSVEFLDAMENSPIMAEQFLYDLRRMIDMARDRIRMRRFIPMLITIPEHPEEMIAAAVTISDITEEVEPEDDEDDEDMQIPSPTEIEIQESPRSEPKSVDSGRESREDSDDSHLEDDYVDDDDDDEISKQKKKSLSLDSFAVRKDSVKNIVNGFESLSSHSNNSNNNSNNNINSHNNITYGNHIPSHNSSPPSYTSSSRLPTPSKLPSRSQSSIPKPTSTTPTQSPNIPGTPAPQPRSSIPTLLGQASPRPVHRALTMPKGASPTSTPSRPPSTIPTMRQTAETRSFRARKGYPVFPGNSMLNKSLPRRKRSVPEYIPSNESSIPTSVI